MTANAEKATDILVRFSETLKDQQHFDEAKLSLVRAGRLNVSSRTKIVDSSIMRLADSAFNYYMQKAVEESESGAPNSQFQLLKLAQSWADEASEKQLVSTQMNSLRETQYVKLLNQDEEFRNEGNLVASIRALQNGKHWAYSRETDELLLQRLNERKSQMQATFGIDPFITGVSVSEFAGIENVDLTVNQSTSEQRRETRKFLIYYWQELSSAVTYSKDDIADLYWTTDKLKYWARETIAVRSMVKIGLDLAKTTPDSNDIESLFLGLDERLTAIEEYLFLKGVLDSEAARVYAKESAKVALTIAFEILESRMNSSGSKEAAIANLVLGLGEAAYEVYQVRTENAEKSESALAEIIRVRDEDDSSAVKNLQKRSKELGLVPLSWKDYSRLDINSKLKTQPENPFFLAKQLGSGSTDEMLKRANSVLLRMPDSAGFAKVNLCSMIIKELNYKLYRRLETFNDLPKFAKGGIVSPEARKVASYCRSALELANASNIESKDLYIELARSLQLAGEFNHAFTVYSTTVKHFDISTDSPEFMYEYARSASLALNHHGALLYLEYAFEADQQYVQKAKTDPNFSSTRVDRRKDFAELTTPAFEHKVYRANLLFNDRIEVTNRSYFPVTNLRISVDFGDQTLTAVVGDLGMNEARTVAFDSAITSDSNNSKITFSTDQD